MLIWSENCVIIDSTCTGIFKRTDTKLYVPVVTLSTQDNSKLLQTLKSGFKRKTSWNKCQSKVLRQVQNQSLDYLTDPSFQGTNRLFVLSGCYGQSSAHRILSCKSRNKKLQRYD